MNETLSTVNSVLGLPVGKMRYKKYLVKRDTGSDFVAEDQLKTYHRQFLSSFGMDPFNQTSEANEPFKFVSNVIHHTYLKAPDGNRIFIRQKSGVLKDDENVSLRSKSFDYEHRYEIGKKRV